MPFRATTLKHRLAGSQQPSKTQFQWRKIDLCGYCSPNYFLRLVSVLNNIFSIWQSHSVKFVSKIALEHDLRQGKLRQQNKIKYYPKLGKNFPCYNKSCIIICQCYVNVEVMFINCSMLIIYTKIFKEPRQTGVCWFLFMYYNCIAVDGRSLSIP